MLSGPATGEGCSPGPCLTFLGLLATMSTASWLLMSSKRPSEARMTKGVVGGEQAHADVGLHAQQRGVVGLRHAEAREQRLAVELVGLEVQIAERPRDLGTHPTQGNATREQRRC